MRASRILFFARTSRWAIVASGTRNACAISAVDSPPTSRSVSATRAAGARAGWQQVKSMRSRSVPVGAGRLAPQPVDGPVAGGGDDPPGGTGRHAVHRPALQGGQEGVLYRLLGGVDVAEEAGEDGDRAPVGLAEDRLDVRRADVGHRVRRPRWRSGGPPPAGWSPGRPRGPRPVRRRGPRPPRW